MRKVVVALALAVVLCSTASAQLLNPSFEEDNFGIPGFIPGWTSYGNLDGLNSGNHFGIVAYDGTKFVSAVASYGTKNGGVYQQVLLAPGIYKVSAGVQAANNDGFVYAAGQPSKFPGFTTTSIRVDTDGGIDPMAAEVMSPNYDTGFQWGAGEVEFTLNSLSTVTIFLHAIQQNAYAGNWSAFDGVELEVVPEPSSILAMASGLAGMAGMVLRRKA